jgi:hypothetical protein
MRFRLRTLLILLAILPPLLAISWVKWQEYREYLAEQQRRAAVQPAAPMTWTDIANGRNRTPPAKASQPQ